MKGRARLWLAVAVLAALLLWLGQKAKIMFKNRPEFLAALRSAFSQVNFKLYGIDKAESLYSLAGLGGHESGWGTGRIFGGSNNIFSITAGSTWKGPTITSGALDPSGRPYVFRKYNTLAESVEDFLKLLARLPRYDKALLYLKAGEAEKFARELQAAGYGDPKDQRYAQKILDNYKAVKSLWAGA